MSLELARYSKKYTGLYICVTGTYAEAIQNINFKPYVNIALLFVVLHNFPLTNLFD